MAAVTVRTETLNRLLRGELSAVETYREALDKVRVKPDAEQLGRMLDDHQDSVEELTRAVVRCGGQPDSTSGAWGSLAQAITGAAKLFGNAAALKALKEGEEHGMKEYEEALEDPMLDAESRELIEGTLLPRQRGHILMVDTLISQGTSAKTQGACCR